MSQEVDSRVVEMRFDNANFEKNTKQTISTIDRLMEKLQFKGAEKGFEKLDAAAENVDFATMQTSLDRLESKFSNLNIVATTALVNITNKFVDAGEKLVKSLSIDQVASGWDKYTEKTSNVQTIMNATGKSIDQVNGYLNKLMWYSDETSYSFSEMTSALSQMTAAGGNIDKMIPMIMGIANATADAGKTGFAFQSTIRNLTQSYSAGHLQLQDWKSLNLMGTATKALKQELIDTAVELGTLKKGEVTIGTFESSLSKKWANTKVMEKTFEKYASMMEAAYEMTQKNKGMTSSEALEKLSGQYGELAERAALAAQQATSFGQAIDSTKDAVSSKWMAVFETFFGNKEEATETWTELSDRLYDIFVPSIDGLNERLKDGLNSGWAQLQGRLGDQADAYSYTLQQVALASGAVTEEQITKAGSFTKALQQNGVSAQLLKASLDEAQTSAEKLLTLSDKEMAAKHYDRETIQRDAEAFAKLNAEIQNGTLDLDEYAQKIGELSGREHLVQSFWSIMDAIGKVVAPVKEAFSEIFPPADGERIYSFAERLDLMTQKLIITDQTAEKIKKTFKGLFTVLKGVTTILSKIGAVAKEAFSLLANAAKPVAQVMLSVGAGLGDFLETIYKVATGSGTLREKLGGIKTALTKLLSPVDALGSMLKNTKIAQYIDTFLKKGEKSTGLLGTLYAVGRRAFDGLSAVIRTAASGGIGILGALGMAISTLLSKLGGLGENAVQVLGLTKPNLEDFQQNLIDMPKNLSKSMSEFASSFQRSMNKINGSVGDAFAPVKQFFTAVKEGFDAISGTDVYRFMSLIDVGLLAFSIGQMAKATKSLKAMLETPLTGMLNSISGTFKQLTSAIKTWQKNESTKTLTGMATAILILAGAMYVMSRIKPDRFTEIAITVFGFVTLLTVSAKLLEPTTKRFTKAFDNLKASALNAATLWGTAAALVGLGIAIGSITKGLSRVMEVLQKGDIAANAAALAVVTASIVAMMLAMRQLSLALVVGEKAMNHKVILSTAVELVALSGAIKVLSTALKPLSEIKFTSLVKAGMAVVSLGGLLTTMATALAAVNKVIGPTGFQNGVAITAMAGGIWIAAQAVSSLANIQLVRLDAAMTSIKTLMLLMTTMSAFSAKTKFGSGAAVLVMSTSLVVLAGAVGLFAVMGDAAIDGLIKVAAGLTALTIASSMSTGGVSSGAGILLTASALYVLAAAVEKFAALGWVDLAKGVIAALSGLGGLTTALIAFTKFGVASALDGLGSAMLKMSAALLILAPAIKLLGDADPKTVGQALQVFLDGMLITMLGGALLTAMPQLAVGLELLAKAFWNFAKSLGVIALATAAMGVLSMFAGPICQAIINAAPDIQEALTTVVTMLCEVIKNCAGPIVEAFDALVRAVIPECWQLAKDGLSFLGVPETWSELFSGIGNAMKDAALGIFDWFGEIFEDDRPVGMAINGIKSLGGKIVEAFKSFFGIASPSKVMAENGEYVMLGVVEGLQNQSILERAKAAMHSAAAAQGTMTAIIGVGTALDSMSYSLKKVTNKQLKYDEAVKKFGKNSETALDALADLQSEQYNFVGFAENLADAFELDDSGKRMMMQLGYSISKNWRPIQEGFNSVWAQVQKSAPEMASKLSRAFGVATQDGVTEVITDLFGTITALVNGDWGGAVTGGITTVLDFMGSEFGQTMMNLGKTMLTFNKLAQGGGTLKVMGQVVKVTGATKNLGSILGNMSGLLGSATGGTGLLGEALGGLGSIGEMITGSGGLLGGLGELGSTLVSVLGSIGPEGWLIGAAIVGGGLLIANWDQVSEFFSGFFDWLGNAFSNLWDWISNGFQGLVDVGKNMISGLWEGITGAAGAVWNGICDFGSAVVDGFCDFFGIHSPSRVMAGIGEYLSLGLAQGITNETDSVVQGVQDVSDTALSTMMDLAQRVGDIASDDFEYEPSIQPVVDMSDVQNGVDWLNDTLLQNGTVALNAERTAGLAANVVRRAEVTKAQQEEANKADQKANPNADIVSSVEALGEHIDSIARAVANMKVQMNGRKLVGEIINDVDEGLGKINRRNNR